MRETPGYHERFLVSLAGAVAIRARLLLVLRYLRHTRFTPVYVALVVAVAVVVNQVLSPADKAAMVEANSTNLNNLHRGRIYTLLTSAVVLDGRLRPSVVGALILVLGVAELAWGSLRTLGVFLYGHVTATLLILVGLRAGIRSHLLDRSLAHAADVGISYGLVAVVGALTTGLPLRRMWVIAVAVLAALAVAAGYSFTFTDFGHLLALLLGMLAGVPARRQARRWLDLGQRHAEPSGAMLAPPAERHPR